MDSGGQPSIQHTVAGESKPAKLSCYFFSFSQPEQMMTYIIFLCVFSIPACCLENSKWSIIFIEFNSIKDTVVEKLNFQSCLNNTREDLIGS